MVYSVEDKLVVAVASSALFDLTECDRVYREQGVTEYRKFQRANEKVVLEPGVAFYLIRRLLGLNGPGTDDRVVEVILLSRNDPDTGLRVFNSIEHHALDITRAGFVGGRDPIRYLVAFNASLFLSANPSDVKDAIMQGAPAGRVFPTKYVDDPLKPELRVAFDFDGVIGDDSSEAVFRAHGLAEFLRTEREQSSVAHPKGPLHKFFSEMSRLQKLELARKTQDSSYQPRIRIAIVTARSASSAERVVTSLREWGIEVDEVFFLGGMEKSKVLEEFRPHIFFDDQLSHIEGAASIAPCAHVPFGIANQAIELMQNAAEARETGAKA